MRYLTFIVMLLCSAPATAQSVLDRLFLTPTERIDLERMRHQGGILRLQGPATGTLQQITLDGYVRNSRGKATAWFNQDKAGAAHLPAQLQGRQHSQRAPVHVPVLRDGRHILLKVGQTYDVDSNTVRESGQPPALSIPGKR
ncbi:hypothetical protein LE190_14390 [Massilia oculi]|uniref:Uncharacterized protein n=1 Tax=Massilia hydrophila TaxID=3044279 RepID=A0ABS7YDR0_9BURK|nr:hypothetical protein [Massilia oculi]MCA1857107.1 hypothetical protein [Massilia oculi]